MVVEQEVLEGVKGIMRQLLPQELADRAMQGAQLDSMDFIQFVVALEQRFQITIPDTTLENDELRTARDWARVVCRELDATTATEESEWK